MAPNDGEGAAFTESEGKTVINLSGVSEEGNFEPLPRGVYSGEIAECNFKYSKAGNPMWELRIRVTEEEYQNRLLFNHLVLNNDVGLSRMKRTLLRLGLTELCESEFDPEDDAVTSQLVGLPCKVRVDIGEYEGRKSNNVKDILAPGGGDDFLG